MTVFWLPVVISLIFSEESIATLSIDVADGDLQNCGNGKQLPGVDFSLIQIISEDDGTTTLNGSARFTEDYENPIWCKLHSQNLERGTWIPGLLSRIVPNLCAVLQAPHEPWYMITRNMIQKTCPFRAGHEEFIKNVNIGNYAELLQVPPSFIEEWRLFFSFATTRDGIRVEECLMILNKVIWNDFLSLCTT